MMIFSAFFFIVGSHENPDIKYLGYVNNGKKKFGTRKPEPVARWTGTLKREEKATFSNELVAGTSQRYLEVSFSAALPTMNRDDGSTYLNFTDDKGSGSHISTSEGTNLLTKIKCVSDCTGSGTAELHTVIIREWDNTYDIEAIAPACTGKACNEDGSPRPYEEGMATISVSNEKLTDKDLLSGTKTETGELPAGFGTFTVTTTWILRRVKEDDVELIVTPDNYDTWLPEPGKNELTKGSMMTVNLKLQGINGKPLKVKAESFELTLNNTSKEPGITINYPLNPDPKNQLPDLRFLHLPMIESTEPDQFISVGSPDGVNGKTYIGSYDGGGWTILKAEAILKDGRRIQGRLLKPGGEIDIRIPKRDPNSHIGEVWLKANGNPGEMDDNETSTGNKNIGDGLSAYEEYRGVITEAEFGKKNRNKFGRLDPQKKEVGLKVDKAETSLFLQGIKWFENASHLNVILFNETEIPPYRRFNENASTAHVFDQYVLSMYKGPLSHNEALGMVFTPSADPDIPKNTYAVVIDIDAIKNAYNGIANQEKPTVLPFTLVDFIAKVVAHELGHGAAAWHHGDTPNINSPIIVDPGPPLTATAFDGKVWKTVNPLAVRIFNRNGVELSLPHTINGEIGKEGNQESGDLDCVMAYVPYCSWAHTTGADGAWVFNQVPMLNIGRKMCISKAGTKINHSIIFFGDAQKGNCLSQLKLK